MNDPFASKYSRILSGDNVSILTNVDHMSVFLKYQKVTNGFKDMDVVYKKNISNNDSFKNFNWIIVENCTFAPKGYLKIYEENYWCFYKFID